MNTDSAPINRNAVWSQTYYVGVTLAVLVVTTGLGIAALWLASFFLYASLRVNPFHASVHTWLDIALAWHDGRLPKEARRLVGSALFGLLLAFGVPAFGACTLLEQSGRRRLYGSARFANEADIRRAGLL